MDFLTTTKSEMFQFNDFFYNPANHRFRDGSRYVIWVQHRTDPDLQIRDTYHRLQLLKPHIIAQYQVIGVFDVNSSENPNWCQRLIQCLFCWC